MQNIMNVLIFFLGVLCISECKVILPRRQELELPMLDCPTVKNVDTDLSKLSGTWYLQMYRSEGGESVRCAKDEFEIQPDQKSAVVNSTYTTESEGKTGSVVALWDQLDKGRFIYHLDKFPLFIVRVSVVVFEENVGYVVDNCMMQADGESHFQIMTKEQNPGEKVIDNLIALARSAGVKFDSLMKVDHKDCPK